MISTAEENQQTQASLHPALDVFKKIFAGIMQQQPTTAPITGKDRLRKEISMKRLSCSENNGSFSFTCTSITCTAIKTCFKRRTRSTNQNDLSIQYCHTWTILSRFKKWFVLLNTFLSLSIISFRFWYLRYWSLSFILS